MGLRIATNVASQTVQRNIEKVSKDAEKSYARLSSGNRIVNAGEDAAGLAIGDKLNSEVRGLKVAQRNANDGLSFVQTAEGGLNEVSNILIRLRELSVQSSSDTIGDNERGFVDKEFQTLKQEVDRIAQVTSFGGRALLNGEGGDMHFQVGTQNNENNSIVFAAGSTNTSVSEIGISSLSVESRDSAQESLEGIDKALDAVNGYRASLGAVQNRLHHASNNLGVQIDNLSDSKSRITDTDIAEEASNLVQKNILLNAGISVLAQANSQHQSALKLL